MNSEFCPSCPAGCGDFTLPTFSDVCFNSESIESSEIEEIFFSEKHATNVGEPKNPISGWTNTGLAANASINEAAILAWLAAAAQTGAGLLRRQLGIGDKPAGEGSEITGPEGKVINVNKRASINFDIMTMDNLTYEVIRWLQCNPELHIWYRTKKYLYGGENGLIATIKNADHILDRGREAIAMGQIVIEFDMPCEPPRDQYPLFASPTSPII
jgi:hypothetical protein